MKRGREDRLAAAWCAVLLLTPSGRGCGGEDDDGDRDIVYASEMAHIPTGCFDMGDAFNEGQIDELPVHNVCITGFDLDIHEVTNVQYEDCVDDGGCEPPSFVSSSTRANYYETAAYADFPVIHVSWYSARNYCTWLDKRLPTEAEWEYAARGGLSGQRYPWGNTISGSDANYLNSGDEWDNDTSEVKHYAPNGYGLYDMAGNVFEWANDRWLSEYYSVSPTNDPQGPVEGSLRMMRGGGWNNDVNTNNFLRVAWRAGPNPSSGSPMVGIRCARD